MAINLRGIGLKVGSGVRVSRVRPAVREGNKRLGRPYYALTILLSAALPALDVVLRVETYGFTIAARDCDDIRILILDGLKQRLGCSPEAVKRSVVMAGNVDVGFVGAHVLQCSLRRESVQERD